ncbi:DUF1877 family protein [bacterium 1xD42-67]|nr:DUF1877 family protein [bacterium 1xD42-67]
MSCLGGFRAITEEELGKLRNVPREGRIPDYLDEMETVDIFDVDKAWDAMHRALCASELKFGNTPAPNCWVILGGEVLRGDREGEEDYLVVCKSPEQVRQVDQFLQGLTEEAFRKLYFSIDPEEYEYPMDEEDFGYTWEYLSDSRPFWHSAAEKGLWVLFDVDQ